MRFLAYGGNAHTERRRIGRWQEFPQHIWSEISSFNHNEFAVGVGLEQDQAFLVLRLIQQYTAGRRYAFTLLFDPSPENWSKFGWNPVYLAQHLLGENNPHRDTLFYQPENLTGQLLAQIISVFPQRNYYQSSSNHTSFQKLVVGSYRLESLFAADSSIIGDVSLEWLGGQIQNLPICFRCGGGWLINGTNEQAQAFNVKLLLTRNKSIAATDASEITEQGQIILQTWRDEDLIITAKKPDLAGTPTFRWSDDQLKFARRLQLLAFLKAKRSLTDNEVETFYREIKTSPFLTEQLEEKFYPLVTLDNVFTPRRTAFLLEQITAGEMTVAQETVDRFEPKTCRDFLSAGKIEPNSLKVSFPANIRGEVWRYLLDQHTEKSDLPARLARAVEDLALDEGTQTVIAELTKNAVKNTASELDWLKLWLLYRRHTLISPAACDLWQAAVWQGLAMNSRTFARDYLAFSHDDGESLLSKSVSTKIIIDIIEFAQNEIAVTGELKDDAVQWLNFLKFSPLRKKIPLAVKQNLIQTTNGGINWQSLETLFKVIQGHPGITVLPADKAELEFLQAEFAEMLDLNLETNFNPLMPQLQKLLGELPRANVTEHHEIERQQQLADEPEKQKLDDLLLKTLTAAPDEKLSDNLSTLLRNIETGRQLELDLAHAVHRLLKDEEQTAAFTAQLFAAADVFAWRRIFNYLPPQLQFEILRTVERQKPEQLAALATEVYQPDLQMEQSNEAFTIALLSYLLSDVGNKVLTEIAVNAPADFVENLRTQYERANQDSFDWTIVAETPIEKDDMLKKSFWRKLFKRFDFFGRKA